MPVLGARIVPGPEAAHLRNRSVVAFAGIGRPAKFFDTLRALGCRLHRAEAFPDHHPYQIEEIERICVEARSAGAVPVTTAKDAARIPPGAGAEIQVLTVSVEWEDESALEALLEPVVARS